MSPLIPLRGINNLGMDASFQDHIYIHRASIFDILNLTTILDHYHHLATMKEAFVNKDVSVTIQDTDIPVPEAGQPLAAMTAALGLYQRLKLPLPWNPAMEPLPLIVYGGATSVGAFVIKFARLSNIHPLIVAVGNGDAFVETLIDRGKGDTIIDYRDGDEAVRSKIKDAAAAGGRSIHCAYDAVGENGSHHNIDAVMTAPGDITTMSLSGDYQPSEGMVIGQTIAGSVHMSPPTGKTVEDNEFGAAFFQFIGRGLAQGWFSGHPYQVRPGGLAGLEEALRDLQKGKASAVKYVVRIGEMEGVE